MTVQEQIAEYRTTIRNIRRRDRLWKVAKLVSYLLPASWGQRIRDAHYEATWCSDYAIESMEGSIDSLERHGSLLGGVLVVTLPDEAAETA